MSRPWIWNLVLLTVIAVMIARFPASLSERQVTLPSVAPPPPREHLALPRPPPPPEEEALREIVSRNLFSPSRGKVEVAATKPPAPPPVAAASLQATLFGVVIEEEGERYAYLQDSSQGGKSRPKKYREGDSFAGMKVKSIRSDRVILEAGSREQTVNLRTPKEGIPFVMPNSRRVNRVDPSIMPVRRQTGREAGTSSSQSTRRLRRPPSVTGNRGSGPVPPPPRRPRPAVRDADSGEEWPGRIDRGGDNYQTGYPEPGSDPGFYEDEEYGGEGGGATW